MLLFLRDRLALFANLVVFVLKRKITFNITESPRIRIFYVVPVDLDEGEKV